MVDERDQVANEVPQTLSVKRAQVEFHNFASLGEPERVMAHFRRLNADRAGVLRRNQKFIGGIAPFLEIGANAGHTSYMLANEFGGYGFALDISADALRHGRALQDLWNLPKAPVRVAGDAVNLPFRDGSLRFVLACQMLSQFMDIEKVFVEVKRVLAPGGHFMFIQEPIRRKLSLRLYRCPYERQMKPWERKLNDWGLLGYIVKDVIGAEQEESFGIRQNHRMTLQSWNQLAHRHFDRCEYEITPADRGWGEHVVRILSRRLSRSKTEWTPARLLGGTLCAICRKAGEAVTEFPPIERFESYFRCPDCSGNLDRSSEDELHCARCGYSAPDQGGVYNLLPSRDRVELYPGDRPDTIDFSLPSHERHLVNGWYALEGVYGAKFRWTEEKASVWMERVRTGPQRIRLRGFVNDLSFAHSRTVTVSLAVNGAPLTEWPLTRPGMFVLEADVPDAPKYAVELTTAPVFQAAGDSRRMGVNISMIRLIPRD